MVDFNLDPGTPIISDEVSIMLQQIDLLFDTNHKEVLGYSEFGSKYDEYLYKLNLSNNALKHQVLSDLRTLNLFDFIPTVEVYLLQGTEQDIALIEISLNRNSEQYQRVYKIS